MVPVAPLSNILPATENRDLSNAVELDAESNDETSYYGMERTEDFIDESFDPTSYENEVNGRGRIQLYNANIMVVSTGTGQCGQLSLLKFER